MNLLDLMVRIGVDDKASERIGSISSDIKSKLAAAAKVGAAAVAAVGAATVAAGKMALDSYANYEQLSGGVAKLYGNAGMALDEYAASVGSTADEVQGIWERNQRAQELVMQNAQQAYKTAGMSANDYMEMATTFSASLIDSLAGDTEEAARITDVAMRAMSDNYNTFGGDMELIENAFKGFSKGNFAMLDNLKLGYGGTRAEMERLIADANEWAAANGKAADLSIGSFADMITAIDYIQQKQKIAGTTAREAMTTIEGSINMTKAAWSNLLTELGKSDGDVGARAAELVESASTALLGAVDENGNRISEGILGRVRIIIKNISDTLPEILPKLQEALTLIIQELVPLIVQMTPVLVEAALMLFTALLDGLAQASPQITEGLIQLLFKLGELLIQYAPQMLAAAGMLMLGILNGIANGIEPVMTKINEMGEQILEEIGSFFMGMFKAGGDLIQNIKDGAAETGKSMADFFGGFIEDGLKAVLGFVGKMLDAGRNLWDNLKKGATGVGNTIADTFRSWIQNGLDNVLGFVGSMWNAGTSLITNLLDGAAQIGWNIANNFWDWLNNAYQQVLNFGSSFYNAGVNIVQGLINGIANNFWAVVDTVLGGLQNVVNSALHFLGIASPSKLFAWMGEMNMEGLAEGIEDAAGEAVRATRNAVSDVYGAASGEVNLGVNAQAAAARQVVIEVNNPVIKEEADVDRILDYVTEQVQRKAAMLAWNPSYSMA